jgi:voltage-gated potassium channel
MAEDRSWIKVPTTALISMETTHPPPFDARPTAPQGAAGLIARLRELYEGDTPEAHRFRYGLLIFDIISVLFIIITSFMPQTSGVELLDVLFGLVILADFAARLAVSHQRWRDLLHPTTWADILAIISFLAPIAGEGAASCASCAR